MAFLSVSLVNLCTCLYFSTGYPYCYNMPRISTRKLVIDWFLESINQDIEQLQQERFADYLEKALRRVRGRVREVMNRLDKDSKRAPRRSLSDVTISDVTISESSDSGGSVSTSLFSSICDRASVNEQQMRRKLRVLQTILRHRYLQARGGEFAIPKSLAWRYTILERLPVTRFRLTVLTMKTLLMILGFVTSFE